MSISVLIDFENEDPERDDFRYLTTIVTPE